MANAAQRPRSTQLRLDSTAFGYFVPIGMLFVGVSRYTREELGGDDFLVGLATTIFFVSAIFARPLAGRWMDRIGRRPFIWPTLVAMSAATVLTGFTTATWQVVIIRLLQGAVGASLYTALAATATDLAPPERRGAAMARLSVMVYLGFAIGPVVGEWLFDRSHWALFAVAGGLTLASACSAYFLPETRPPTAAGEPEPTSLPVATMVRAVMRPGSAQFCVGFGYACLISFLTTYSRELGVGSSGGLFLTFALCTLCIRAVSGPLGDRIGYAAVALPSVLCVAAGLLGLAIAWEPWVSFPAIGLVGIGFGGSFPALTAIAAQRAPDSARGAALGAFLSFNDLGNALAGPFVGLLGEAVGFRWLYGAPALVAVAGAVVCLSLLRRPVATASLA